MTPDEHQREAIVDLVTTGRQVSRLHGYAGTGKTSGVAAHVVAALQREGVSVQALAPTGKAARVLRGKGLTDARTIHSWLYTPSKRERAAWRERWTEAMLRIEDRYPALLPHLISIDTATPESLVGDSWKAIEETVSKKLRETVRSLRSEKRFELAFNAGGAIVHYEEAGYPAAEVLLIDEASMVSEAVAEDLLRTGSRLIFVGDPAQLPPVGARRSQHAMGNPNHLLTKVYRQKGAEGAGVLKLATEVRKSVVPSVEPTKRSNLLRMEEYDQVLCWRNATRERVNAEIRRRLGRRDPMMPEPGDRLVCIKNTKSEDEDVRTWMNGEQVTVMEAGVTRDPETLALVVQDDDQAEHEVFAPVATLGGHKAEQEYLDGARWGSPDPAFAFGFGLTVHKSQGSEWGRVLLVDESSDMIAMTSRREGRDAALTQARQWLYTGITRAASRVDIVRDLRGV